jgi:hypothetical protein
MATRNSGRAEAYKTTCEDYCAQRSFGPGCKPCKIETFTTEAACLFPGPFGIGKLCYVDPKTKETTDRPCCMRYKDGVTAGNLATTCKIPKRDCDCDQGTSLDPFDYSAAFEASSFMAALPRAWDANTSTCVKDRN